MNEFAHFLQLFVHFRLSDWMKLFRMLRIIAIIELIDSLLSIMTITNIAAIVKEVRHACHGRCWSTLKSCNFDIFNLTGTPGSSW